MKTVSVLFALLLAGCNTVKPVTLADGTQGQRISCHGSAHSMGDCIAKAGEICGSAGYTVMNQAESSSPMLLANGANGNFSATGVSISHRELFIKCGGS